jgi:PAS domain S-box-containing protein
MPEILLASITFILTSGYVLAINYFAGSSFTLQKAIALPILIVLLLIYRSSLSSWKNILNNISRWIMLATFTIFIQLLVISTGDIKSPFLIFIHLFMVGISLIFNFTTSLLFLLASCIVIALSIAFHQNLLTLVLSDPYTIILQIFSLIPIIPVAYIISQHYHLKDKLFNTLHAQVITDETILANVDELIIITDTQLRILSVNDAVERTIQKSDSEIIGKPIFEILLMKDSDGKLANRDTFIERYKNKANPKNIDTDFVFINSRLAQRKVHIHIQPIRDPENRIRQISFIISNPNQKDQKRGSLPITLSKAKAKYDAISEKVKQELLNNSLTDIRLEITLLEKIENDMYILQTLKDNSKKMIEPASTSRSYANKLSSGSKILPPGSKCL